MKLKNILMTAAIALVGVASANAANPSYAVGNLIMGFYDTVTNNAYEFNLGAATTYVADHTAGTSFTLSTNIASDLSSAFGSSWASDANLQWGIVATSQTSGWSAVGNHPTQIDWISQTESTFGTQASNPSLNSSARSSVNTQVGNYGANFAAMTATSNGLGAVINASTTSLSNNQYFGEGQKLGANVWFGSASNSLVGAFTSGSSALDLFQILNQSSSNTSYQGTFMVTSAGNVVYGATVSAAQSLAAVPEPSTYAMMGIGAIGFLTMFRRRSIKA